MAALLSLVTIFGVIAFLVGERAHAARLRWVAKPLASAGFVGVALASGATGSAYGRWVLAALVLSWLGDVLLIPSAKAAFLGGLGSFLLGHLAFAGAFAARGVAWPVAALAALAATIVAWPVARWLLPHVDDKMRAPVLAYMAAISTMVALALGSVAARPSALALAGALGFYASDLSVARDRFVAPGFVNRLWGIPLYYAAQLAFAFSVSA